MKDNLSISNWWYPSKWTIFKIPTLLFLTSWLFSWLIRIVVLSVVLILQLTNSPGAPMGPSGIVDHPQPVNLLVGTYVFAPQDLTALPLAIVGVIFTIAVFFFLPRIWGRTQATEVQRVILTAGVLVVCLAGELMIQTVSPDVIFPDTLS